MKHALCILSLVWIASISGAYPNQTDPSNEFIPLAAQYLNLLSNGQYEAAIQLVDLQGLADHLMRQRMTHLKKEEPDMTAEREAELIENMRNNEVHPNRLRAITLSMMAAESPPNMTWKIAQTGRSPLMPNGVVVIYDQTNPDGKTVRREMGMWKIGPSWCVAPQVIDLMKRAAAESIPAAKIVEAPGPARALGTKFLDFWKAGDLEKAYDLFTEAFKQRVPLLNYLETTRQVMRERGLLESYEFVSSLEYGKGQFRLIYNLKFNRSSVKAAIEIAGPDDAWMIYGLALPYNRP